MAWSNSLPNAVGSYWMRHGDTGQPAIVTVIERSFAGQATVQPALVVSEMVALSGDEQWEGPIPPPA